VGRKLLAAGLLRSLLSPFVASDRLQRGVGDPLGGIDDFRRVAEVEDELLRVRQIPLNLLAEGELQGGVALRFELRDLDLLIFEKISLPLDGVDDSLIVRGKATTAAGVGGHSLVLDGRSLVELKDSAKLSSGEFTVSLWFNPYDLAGGQQMLVGKNRYSLDERQWGLTIEPDGKLKAHLRQSGWSTIPCNEPLVAGRWHLATLAVDAQKAEVDPDFRAP